MWLVGMVPGYLGDSDVSGTDDDTPGRRTAQMVNPRSDRAMYRQIADDIREAIRSGKFEEGDMLPSEAALMAEHGTSQGTARKAIALLRAEGWIVSASGKGSYVRRRPVVFRRGNDRFARAQREGANGKAAFDAEIGAQGLRPTTEVIVEGPIPAPDEAATLLDLGDGDLVVARRRRMMADGEPVQLATSYIPWSIAEGTQIVQENSGPGGIYARIEEAGHKLGEFSEDIRARPAFPEEAEALGLESGMPVMLLDASRVRHRGRAGRGLRLRDDRRPVVPQLPVPGHVVPVDPPHLSGRSPLLGRWAALVAPRNALISYESVANLGT